MQSWVQMPDQTEPFWCSVAAFPVGRFAAGDIHNSANIESRRCEKGSVIGVAGRDVRHGIISVSRLLEIVASGSPARK